jgi:Winged helix DNA-binding domain
VAQRLVGQPFESPTEAVRGLLAVQSQDYPGAKWAVGQRLADTSDAELDRLFDAGAILRTHVMRPTWHFVDPADIRWLLALTAPRVHQANAYQYRLQEIDPDVAASSRTVIERALAGGGALTRPEIGRVLTDAGIPATSLRLGYFLGHAELEGLICSGPRRGRQQTYALLEERVPPARPRSRDEALTELARRYVEGHGPAQVADLSWWSGLTMADSRVALELATPPLRRESMGERAFWVADRPGPSHAASSERPAVHLLPNYDELLIAFRDRTDAIDPALPEPARVAESILAHIVVRHGLVVGGWRRSAGRDSTRVTIDLLVELSETERRALEGATRRLGSFLGRPVEVAWTTPPN